MNRLHQILPLLLIKLEIACVLKLPSLDSSKKIIYSC